jgi:hypothetical protein
MNSTQLATRAFSHLKTVATFASGRMVAGRGLTVLPNDIFLVSYLRSGSTWSRFLFGNLIHQDEEVTFTQMSSLLPSIYDWPDRRLRRLPRVLKSHECFDPRYPRVVYLVRDPRDVAVSFYFYNLKVRVLPEGYPMEEFVERWIRADVVGYADRLGSWQDHVLSWLRLRKGEPGFTLVHYEELLANPVKELSKLAAALRIPATRENVERAVFLSSASRMQSLEKEQATQWEPVKGTRQDIPFVREAKAGAWKMKLPPQCVIAIERAWGSTMEELGYELEYAPKKLVKA